MIFSISFKKSIILTVLLLLIAISTGYAEQAATSSGSTSASASTDPNTGAANVNVPIEVPPGRNGMAPNLALSYNSNKRNGWIGVGWDLKTSFIQRNTKWGLDYSDNDYVVDGNRELAARGDWGTNYYGHKTEGAFTKYHYNSSTGGWEATTKNGTKHYYGTTTASRQDDPADATRVFKWMIDKIEDTNGNYMTFSYTKDQEDIYLDRIDYTGGTSLSTTKYVQFYYDATRTDAYPMYTSNFSITTAKRLKTIEVVSNSNMVRAYELEYDADPATVGSQYSSTGRSILYSVQQYGNDASVDTYGNVTGGSSLPAVTFTYQETDKGFTQTQYSLASIHDDDLIRVQGDFNGDGKNDFLITDANINGRIANPNTGTYTYLSNGDGTFTQTQYSLNLSYEGIVRAQGDYNGDGKTDFLITEAGADGRIANPNTGTYTYLSHGDGTFSQTQYSLNLSWDGGLVRAQGDFNGDGKTDFLITDSTAVGGIANPDTRTYTYLSNGDGTFTQLQHTLGLSCDCALVRAQGDFNGDGNMDFFITNATADSRIADPNTSTYIYLSDGDGTFTQTQYSLNLSWDGGLVRAQGDFNGDGKTDFIITDTKADDTFINTNTNTYTYVHRIANPDTRTYTYLSNGDGTFTQVQHSLNLSYEGLVRAQGDYNGDGRTDFLITDSTSDGRISNPNTNTYTYLSNGDGTFTQDQYSLGLSWDSSLVKAQGDFDGDGKADFLITDAGSDSRITQATARTFLYQSMPVTPDLLTSMDNGIGSITSITYEPSSLYTNTLLPFIVRTVSSLSVSDGNGHTFTTGYTYADGYYDIEDKEYRGFGYVKTTNPTGDITETWFHQDDVYKGLQDRNESTDSSGNLYTKAVQTYGSTSPYSGVVFPHLDQTDDYQYDGAITARNVKTTFTYDAYGNIAEQFAYGDTAISGDERFEYREYGYDTTRWIVSLPHHTWLNNNIGTKASEAWSTYGVSGNLLTETKWNNSGTDPVTTYTYDAYGNVESITDPRGNTTTITYDSAYTYPYQATNPVGHIATTVYDPKYGSITSETNVNGNTATYVYDEFGRLTKMTNPLDTGSAYGTVSYEYQDCGTANLRVITYSTEESGTANYLKSEVCLDGLERTVKTWKEGPDGKTIVADIEYDNAGRVGRKSLPYFDGIGYPKWITYTYDPAGRVIQIVNPDGTTTITAYDKGTTTYIDANGHKKVEIKDVYDRLIKVEEHTGTAGAYSLYATTTYEYSTLGNLTKLTDAQGNRTTMTYDTLGRKLTMDDPDMGIWSYTYDLNGNLATQTDAKSKTVTFTYDSLNRITLKDNPTDPDITYIYDELFSTNSKGQLTTLIDASGTTKYYYDELTRTVKTTKTVDSTDYTTETTYDALGRTKSVTYPDNETVNYTYDTGGNLSIISDGTTTYASYSNFNALGQNSNITYGNGVTTAYTYETDTNLLKTITTNEQSQGDILSLSYNYDNTDNITNLTDNLDGTHTQIFTYDDLDRLTSAQSTAYGPLSYAYDTIGNITSKRGVSYTYGGPHPHAVTETRGGNMAPDRALVYNDDNKPSSINFNGDITDFVYSGVWSSHNRAKKVTNAATTVIIGSLYEQTGSSSTKYIFAGSTRLALKTSTETYYYHQDHLGSSRVITDSSGAKVEEIHYYPYGETLSDTGDTPGNVSVKHKFTSQELDSETGLYYYGTRCYDPVLGRFTTADTIVSDPADPQSLNRYSYVQNNPIKYTDPSGHGWFKKLRRWVRRIFRPKKVIRNTIKSATSFSIQNAVATAAQLSGYDPGGMIALTLRAASSFAASQLTDKVLGNSDGSRKKAVARPFTGKGGSQRNKPSGNSPNRKNLTKQDEHNLLYLLSMVLNQTGVIISTGEHTNFLGAAKGFKEAGRNVFFFSAGLSAITGIDALLNGDNNLAMKSGLDVAMGYVMLEGGVYGFIVGGSYFILDGGGYIVPIINYVEPALQYQRSNLGINQHRQ